MRRTGWLLAGCASIPACVCSGFPGETSRHVGRMPAESAIEVGLGGGGRILEVEFHVPPSELPAEILAAVGRLCPGGEVVDCEIEYVGGTRYYEVTKRAAGKETELMLDEAGRPFRWEVEIEASAAPKAVLDAAASAAPGTLRKVEEIRDAGKALLAYHVKKEDRGIHYKIEIAPGGERLGVWRETKAEVEVPIE